MTILVRELYPGSWYLVIHFRGRRIQRKVADNQKDAEKIMRELEVELQFRGYGALDRFKPQSRSGEGTVSGYADKWIGELRASGLKPSTVDSYEDNLEHHIKPFFGSLLLIDVTYSRVKDFISDRMATPFKRSKKEGAKEYHYSKDSVRLMVATLRAMMEEAVREEILEENPIHNVGKFYGAARRLRDDPDPFSLTELMKTEEAAGSWLAFSLFQSRTGARVGEAIALQWPDIDWDKRQAYIRRTMPVNRLVGDPKTPASKRWVEMSPQLVIALHDLERRQLAFWFGKGAEMPKWVFATPEGNAPDYSVWRKAFARLQKKAGVRERRPHDLRHTFASLSLQAGKPITWVSRMLGHKNPEITLKIYARWAEESAGGNRIIFPDRGAGTAKESEGNR